MTFKTIAAIAAAGAALALASAADAKPNKNKNLTWDERRQVWVDNNWTPPGLAKKPYGLPPGQAKKMGLYTTGQHLPRTYYRDDDYWLTNPMAHDLRVAPPGYRWVRVGNDVYLTQTRTGLIAEVIAGLFN